MLIIAQGTIYRPVTDQERRAAAAWLGPMTDAGFLHGGWIDPAGNRLWMVISAPDLAEAQQRLDKSPPSTGRLGVLHHHTSRRAPDLLTAPGRHSGRRV